MTTLSALDQTGKSLAGNVSMLSEDQAMKIIEIKANKNKPMAMSPAGHTTEFPREDNIFKTK